MESPKTIRVLIAEDEDSFRISLQHVLLKDDAFDFLACDNGDETLEMIQREHFDIILLDYRMPGHSGLNILQWMHEQKMDTPVILLTGMGSENIAVEAMKLGAYDYIPKENFDKGHLIHLIKSTYERYLFRKERALREETRRQKTASAEILDMLSRSVGSLAELMNVSLASTTSGLMTLEKSWSVELPQRSQAVVTQTLSLFREHREMMTFCARSLLELSRIMHERLSAPLPNDKHQAALKQLLEGIENHVQHGTTTTD